MTLKAVCVLLDKNYSRKGIVRFREHASGVEVFMKIWDIPEGEHGFHIHKTGNMVEGAHSLCEHFTINKKHTHGDLNDPDAHSGDLGNVVIGSDGYGEINLIAKFLHIRGDVSESILGRSVVVHDDRDDLGKGGFSDSKISGHSGGRLLYGVIGRDEECN